MGRETCTDRRPPAPLDTCGQRRLNEQRRQQRAKVLPDTLGCDAAMRKGRLYFLRAWLTFFYDGSTLGYYLTDYGRVRCVR